MPFIEFHLPRLRPINEAVLERTRRLLRLGFSLRKRSNLFSIISYLKSSGKLIVNPLAGSSADGYF
jgi:hypothetical protein